MGFTHSVKSKKGFTLIEVMVVAMIISLLAAIAIPNFIHIRSKGYCSQAENDASMIERAITSYFSNPWHTDLPDVKDIGLAPLNPVVITGDVNDTIYIIVTDRTGRCPDDYQNADEHWDSVANTYTLEME